MPPWRAVRSRGLKEIRGRRRQDRSRSRGTRRGGRHSGRGTCLMQHDIIGRRARSVRSNVWMPPEPSRMSKTCPICPKRRTHARTHARTRMHGCCRKLSRAPCTPPRSQRLPFCIPLHPRPCRYGYSSPHAISHSQQKLTESPLDAAALSTSPSPQKNTLTWPTAPRRHPQGAYKDNTVYDSDYSWPSASEVVEGDEWQRRGDCGMFGSNC